MIAIDEACFQLVGASVVVEFLFEDERHAI